MRVVHFSFCFVCFLAFGTITACDSAKEEKSDRNQANPEAAIVQPVTIDEPIRWNFTDNEETQVIEFVMTMENSDRRYDPNKEPRVVHSCFKIKSRGDGRADMYMHNAQAETEKGMVEMPANPSRVVMNEDGTGLEPGSPQDTFLRLLFLMPEPFEHVGDICRKVVEFPVSRNGATSFIPVKVDMTLADYSKGEVANLARVEYEFNGKDLMPDENESFTVRGSGHYVFDTRESEYISGSVDVVIGTAISSNKFQCKLNKIMPDVE